MPSHALGKCDHVVREISKRRGAWQKRDIVTTRERHNGFDEPGLRHLAIDRDIACSKQRSAELRLLVAKQHLCTAFGRRVRCR